MNHILYPALGTLSLDDEHVFGFLPGYYPGPLPSVDGFDRDDFVKIAHGGFGNPMNNYAWSMAAFNGALYVGTGRNTLWVLEQRFKVAGFIPSDFEFPNITRPADPSENLPQFFQDMRAEIWRYHDGTWEMVHKAAPGEGVGYRSMIVFEGVLYAGVGGGFGDTLLLRSTDGEHWTAANTTAIDSSNTRAMAVHNGKLYLGTAINSTAEIFVSSHPETGPWTQVTDFASTAHNNTGIQSLVSFNGSLYASTKNTDSGFEVWKSKVPDPQTQADCERVVYCGAGDGRNFNGQTTAVFNDNLCIGTITLPFPLEPPEWENFKGFELIRIPDTEDQCRLVIGSYPKLVHVANNVTAERGIPESGWPAGFANPLNFYCWSLEEHDGILYLGTFDASSFLQYLPIEDLAKELGLTEEQLEQLQQIPDAFYGADLWKTNNGTYWVPVTLNGFDSPNNYGFRTMVSGSLYIGTANPFQNGGCEVWKAPSPLAESTDAVGVRKDVYATTDNVYATGSGFQPDTNVDVYIVADLSWSDGDPIPDDVSSDRVKTLTADDYGTIGPATVWPAPLTPGEYDLVFDANQNGTYDYGIDAVDHPDHPGFTVRWCSVDGEAYPVDKLSILAPWLALGAVIIVGAGTILRCRRAQS
jgi:hypothetical protein